MRNVIEVEALRKEYRRHSKPPVAAIDGLDLAVPEGGVFGFLGPNGSGKTTTIRCLLGLVAPSAGSCRLLGADVPGDLRAVIGKVGSVVETPMFFPTFTARRNLRLLAHLDGIGEAAVGEVLETAGLTERADDLVRTYSLGMKQRLGLAAALLKDPAVLILDEPANGLDPAGIREVRDLLRRLGSEGRTVFLSSHILSEVQQTCDSMAILARGRCVASGTVAEVLARASAGRALIVRVDDPPTGLRALTEAGIAATPDRDGSLRVEHDPDQSAQVTRLLAAADVWVTEMRPSEATLEDVFLELTGEVRPG